MTAAVTLTGASDEQVADLLERVRFAAGAAAITGYVKASPAEVARRLVVEHGAVAFLPEPTVARAWRPTARCSSSQRMDPSTTGR
jgi:hypothetical protein